MERQPKAEELAERYEAEIDQLSEELRQLQDFVCIMWEQGGMKFQVGSMMRLYRYSLSCDWEASLHVGKKNSEIRERFPKFFLCH